MVRFYKNVACVLLIAMSLQAEGDRVDFPDGRIHLLSGGSGVLLSDAEKGLEFIVKSVNKCLAKEAAWPVWKKAAIALGVAGLVVAIYKNRHRFPRWRPGGRGGELAGAVAVPGERRPAASAAVHRQQADVCQVPRQTPAQRAANEAKLAEWKKAEEQRRQRQQRVSPTAVAMREAGTAEPFLRAINDPAQVLAFLNRRIQKDVDHYRSGGYQTPVTDMLFSAVDAYHENFKVWPIPDGIPYEYSDLSIARLVQICTGKIVYDRLLEPARESELKDSALLFGYLYQTLRELTLGGSDESRRVRTMAVPAIIDAAMTAIAQHDYAGDLEAAKAGILVRLKSNFPPDRKGRFPDAASRERAVGILAALSCE